MPRRKNALQNSSKTEQAKPGGRPLKRFKCPLHSRLHVMSQWAHLCLKVGTVHTHMTGEYVSENIVRAWLQNAFLSAERRGIGDTIHTVLAKYLRSCGLASSS